MNHIAVYKLTLGGKIPDHCDPLDQAEAATSKKFCDDLSNEIRAAFARCDATDPDDIFDVEFELYAIIEDDDEAEEMLRQEELDEEINSLVAAHRANVR